MPKISQARKQVVKSRKELLEGFRLGFTARSFLFVVSCIVGLSLYSSLVYAFYSHLYDVCLRADVIKESFNEIPASHVYRRYELDDERIYSLLQQYQLLSDDETTPESLKSDQSPNFLVYDSLHKLKSELHPTSNLIWRLARAGQQVVCGCNSATDDLCDDYYTAQVAAAIAQLPSPSGVSGNTLSRSGPESALDREVFDGLDGFFGDVEGAKPKKTATTSFLTLFGHGMTSRNYRFRLERPSPEMSPEGISNALAARFSCGSSGAATSSDAPVPTSPVSTSSAGTSAPALVTPAATNSAGSAPWKTAVQRQQLQKFVAVLVTKTRGSPNVRSARIWVNGIIGKERLAIIVLAIFFLLLFLQRSLVRIKHDKARAYVVQELSKLDEFTPWTPLNERQNAADNILKSATRYQGTIPLSILAAAHTQMTGRLSANAGAQGAANDDYVGMRAAQERQELDSSRTLFDILLPTFPAIGFIGTVGSLLVAMSQADRIVSATDPFAKGLAASQVTDILSLCFSTTFLALCAVLVFSPLSLWQQAREHNLVDDVHRLVELVLRPGQ
jgi:MotA/TolQ/ExbB proton channel family